MQIVLHKRHRGESKMVGKIFPIAGTLILLHEESGTQRLHKHNAPGGLDVEALDYAASVNVDEVHHHQRNSPVVRVCRLGDVLAYGIEETWDGRRRLFLPEHHWTERRFTYTVPWIKGVLVLDDALGKGPKAAPHPVAPPVAAEVRPRLPGF